MRPFQFLQFTFMQITSCKKAVKIQTVNYYESCHLLSSSQFAYRKLHSTQTALHCIIDECHNNINNGEINILACLVLSKAFDVLDRGHPT